MHRGAFTSKTEGYHMNKWDQVFMDNYYDINRWDQRLGWHHLSFRRFAGGFSFRPRTSIRLFFVQRSKQLARLLPLTWLLLG